MKFEFYVLNYNFNKNEVEMFNIFQNIKVSEWTEKEIRKYLRSPKNYNYLTLAGENYTGFEALVKKIDLIIMCEEWSRCEYEIAVGGIFITELRDIIREDKDLNPEDFKELVLNKEKRNEHLEKWDCYQQANPNMEIIVRECIYQYKKQLKEKKNAGK